MAGKHQSIKSAVEKVDAAVFKVAFRLAIAFATFLAIFLAVYVTAFWWHSAKCVSTTNFFCDAATAIGCYWWVGLAVGLPCVVLSSIAFEIYRSFRPGMKKIGSN